MSPREIYIAKSGAKYAPTLPEDAVTRTFGIFGVKRSGKTTTARVMVEGMCRIGGHVAILDPVGVWWGVTRDGEKRGSGIPGIVIGGKHADVPLEETGGELVAELVMARHYPVVVIDMKLMRKGAMRRFMADYLETLFYGNELPLHQMFEEADRALPQNPRGNDPTLSRVIGAAEDIVKLGGSRGLGSSFVSQRFATVTKNVTEQVEALFLHRMTGPNDLKAVLDWIKWNGDPAATQSAMAAIPSLKVGEAFLYSPGWLRLLEKVRMRAAQTLDSSATPTEQEVAVDQAATRAPVNLETLRERMAETVERAQANDPTELRKQISEKDRRIAELERQLAERPDVESERVEVPMIDPELVARLEAVAGTLDGTIHDVGGRIDTMRQELNDLAQPVHDAAGEVEQALEKGVREVHVAAPGLSALAGQRDRAAAPPPSAPPPAASSNGALGKGEMALLQVAARYHPLRLTKAQLATLAKRGTRSSTLDGQLSKLSKAGMLDRGGGDIGVTDAGLQTAGVEPVVLDAQGWQQVLPEGPAELFAALLALGGRASKAEIAERAGVSATSSTTDGKLSMLRRNGLVSAGGGVYELTPLAYGSS